MILLSYIYAGDTITVKSVNINLRNVISECDSLPDYTLTTTVTIKSIGFSNVFKRLFCKKTFHDTTETTYMITGKDTVDSIISFHGGNSGSTEAYHWDGIDKSTGQHVFVNCNIGYNIKEKDTSRLTEELSASWGGKGQKPRTFKRNVIAYLGKKNQFNYSDGIDFSVNFDRSKTWR